MQFLVLFLIFIFNIIKYQMFNKYLKILNSIKLQKMNIFNHFLFYYMLSFIGQSITQVSEDLGIERKRCYLAFVRGDLNVWKKRLELLSSEEIEKLRKQIRYEFAKYTSNTLQDLFLIDFDMINANYYLSMDYSNLVWLQTAVGIFRWFVLTRDQFTTLNEDFYCLCFCLEINGYIPGDHLKLLEKAITHVFRERYPNEYFEMNTLDMGFLTWDEYNEIIANALNQFDDE
uniref:Uncharacterized protein orf229 n=1 Tax=Cyanophora paradoxa TaxID=2762 RepID=E9P1F5_CYAPA|nr:hypothetical protein CYPAM_p37 [Cyanophora paradoxa]ADW79207.1 hypothetical protein [Cyanophora paradoxa]